MTSRADSGRVQYAKRRIIEDISAALTERIGQKARISKDPSGQRLLVEESVGSGRGNVWLSQVVNHDLPPELSEVVGVLDREYPETRISDLYTKHADEYQQLVDELITKLAARPSRLYEVPELAQYDGPLKPYTAGHLPDVYECISSKRNTDWLMSLLKISREKLEIIREKVGQTLGDEVLELMSRLRH